MPQQPQRKLQPGEDVTALMSGQDVTDLMNAPPATTTSQDQKKSGGFATLGDAIRAQFPHLAMGTDLVVGAGKGLASTVLGASQLINKGTAAVGLSKPVNPEVWDAARSEFTTPTNTTQSVGKGAEQIAEFFVPGGAVTKAGKAINAASKLGKVAVRAGLEGAAGAGMHALQTGVGEGATAVGAAGAAGSAMIPPTVRGAGKAVSWLGQRVESALIKASKADVENGFRIGNVFKHQLGGSIEDSLSKADQKLQQLGSELKAELNAVGPGGTKPMVDVWRAIDDAQAELRSQAARYTGSNESIERAIESIKADVQAQQGGLVVGMSDLATANEIKRGIGDFGAWQYGKTDPDASAKELVANTIYRKLRQAIESTAPNSARIRDLNKAIGEIIPIRQAIMRRIPVEQRQNVVNLGDMIGIGTGAWLLPIANRLVRSGPMADAMVTAGEKFAHTPARAAGPGMAGVASQVKR